MDHGLGLSDSDDEKHVARQDQAAQAIHAAGLDSEADDVRDGDLHQVAAETEEAEASGDDNTFKALGLEGSDDEFNDRHDLEDHEEKQPSPGPRPLQPDRMYRPHEVLFLVLYSRHDRHIWIFSASQSGIAGMEDAPA